MAAAAIPPPADAVPPVAPPDAAPPNAAPDSPPPPEAVGAGVGPRPFAPPPAAPSGGPKTFFGWAPPRPPTGMGSGRLSALLASCSADIAWYMSKPMKLIAL